ncbi:2214_t:CDS:1, partial [Entrophospora sp. SA101]
LKMLRLKSSNWKNKISDVLTDVLRIVRNHHAKLEGGFCTYCYTSIVIGRYW